MNSIKLIVAAMLVFLLFFAGCIVNIVGEVFNSEAEFASNLSILDLLFNEGPEALTILKSCLR